jgi:hypothetical protein
MRRQHLSPCFRDTHCTTFINPDHLPSSQTPKTLVQIFKIILQRALLYVAILLH